MKLLRSAVAGTVLTTLTLPWSPVVGGGPGTVEPVDALDVVVDPSGAGGVISPLITGIASTYSPEEMRALGVTITNWGGNPSTRFNYEIGHAWNNGADWEFRNTNYGADGDALAAQFEASEAAGAAVRLAVPTLGWVARDDSTDTCSFPQGDRCLPADEVGTCGELNVPAADPELANVESTPAGVAAWVERLAAAGHVPAYISMDNEPELWGSTHVDVHPECPTFEEILDRYLTYATAIREVAPDAKLAGPVTCCWFEYWNIDPGPASGPDTDWIPWFLQQVAAHDAETGVRTIDALDVHYYPQNGVYGNSDPGNAELEALRLRSTRALWDPNYIDESWIRGAIMFLPRLREQIEANYPGLAIIVTEWSFGADDTVNGALAMADALAVFGREGVEAATYWFRPEFGSPGSFAFAMHGNYDGAGSRFGGRTIPVETPDITRLGTYAALGDDGVIRVMLINKDPATTLSVALDVVGVTPTARLRRFTYGAGEPAAIVGDDIDPSAAIEIAPYSITIVELPG